MSWETAGRSDWPGISTRQISPRYYLPCWLTPGAYGYRSRTELSVLISQTPLFSASPQHRSSPTVKRLHFSTRCYNDLFSVKSQRYSILGEAICEITMSKLNDDEELSISTGGTPTVSPENGIKVAEMPAPVPKERELTLRSASQVVGGFMLLFNS